jgi:LPXTG-site transpeptidase (sortase) family protein
LIAGTPRKARRIAGGGRRAAAHLACVLLLATTVETSISTAPEASALSSPPTAAGAQRAPVALQTGAPASAVTSTVVIDRPTTIRIPAINVEAPMTPLGLEDDGALEAPEEFSVVGWYEDGPEPGEAGATVVAGHVDSYEGPAVFYRLRELVAGDQVQVIGADGVAVTYTVNRVGQYPKDGFPTDEVYSASSNSTLRLITCGGDFDRAERSYKDNVVVYAE